MKNIENITILKDRIIPIQEFIDKLQLNVKKEDIDSIEFIVENENEIIGVMISSVMVHKHEEMPDHSLLSERNKNLKKDAKEMKRE